MPFYYGRFGCVEFFNIVERIILSVFLVAFVGFFQFIIVRFFPIRNSPWSQLFVVLFCTASVKVIFFIENNFDVRNSVLSTKRISADEVFDLFRNIFTICVFLHFVSALRRCENNKTFSTQKYTNFSKQIYHSQLKIRTILAHFEPILIFALHLNVPK